MNTMTPYRRAFTLLELVAAILVMSIISVTIFPVIHSASESFISARQARSSTEQAAFALDRIVRVIRQAPIGTDESGVGITASTSSSLTLSDGNGFQLTSSTLELLVPGSSPVPLCKDVDTLELTLLKDDGTQGALDSIQDAHRIHVRLVVESVELEVVVHPRVWIGQEGATS